MAPSNPDDGVPTPGATLIPGAPGGPASSAPASTSGHVIPVSDQTMKECIDSACLWVAELPDYADRNQRKADCWAIAAGILAAITSLSIWPVLTETEAAWAKTLVSVVALAAAVCALVPRIKNYSEMATEARQLVSKYADAMGRLRDLRAMGVNVDQQEARRIMVEFAATKAKKDVLHGLPERDWAIAKHHLRF